MAKLDPEREAHKAWLGLVQPVGLVVSPPALVKAQVVLDKNVIDTQQALPVRRRAAGVGARRRRSGAARLPAVRYRGARVVRFGSGRRSGRASVPDALAVPLPDHGETLRPSYAAIDGMADGKVLLLVQVVERGLSLDRPPPEDARKSGMGWPASPQARFERLLRDTGVPAGLLLNGDELRLVYAPRGESSGHMGFPVAEMCAVRGRALLGAVHMLLSEYRVFGAPDRQRLLDLLVESRKYQNEVSNRLAEQVLSALWELLRGFQAADEAANGRVLHDLPRADPQQIYGGLLTVIMRLVFLLYAEDQGLMPDDPVYARNYAIGGLFERLREDAGRHPDTMDQRYGAYAWLLTTFRLIFDGAAHAGLRLPERHGQLFNPDEYAFLEGRPPGVLRVKGETFEAPRVSDGVIWRVLEGLLVLDGERLSYRALDVEQIGSVYESMMGFDVRTLPGRALAVRPKNVVFDVHALLAQPATKRAAWLKEQTECDLAAGGAQALKEARTAEDVVVALGRKVAPQTPRPLAPGALFLQPGEERRRSGSHYTPRELTEPIVRTTLRPVLEALGPKPTPDQILELKVCDPAMGSGAFLVEACRQLAAALVAAWEAHECTPKVPADEDALLHARRLVAQRCLYGVDKNRFAVNLAKLSLWLVTLARDHAFTFLDHALKHGDSLVGLTKAQLGAFHWSPPDNEYGPLFKGISADVIAVTGWRQKIQALGDGEYDQRSEAWKEAEDVVEEVRLIGDLCIAAYFGAEKDKDRETLRREYRAKVDAWKKGGHRTEIEGLVEELRGGERPVLPFHWEIEFPEVFGRSNPGFDAMVGNPPFLGGRRFSEVAGQTFLEWLNTTNEGSRGRADLVAYFFRRGFALVRLGGAFGLISTNSIRQSDTRITGLQWIREHNGWIFAARRRLRWPGTAAVVVSVVHIFRMPPKGPTFYLDGMPAEKITAYLFPFGPDGEPPPLQENSGKALAGINPNGKGFVLSRQARDELVTRDAACAQSIHVYVGGEEINSSADDSYDRYIIGVSASSEHDLHETSSTLHAHLYSTVRLQRQTAGETRLRTRWWEWSRPAKGLDEVRQGKSRLLAASRLSNHIAIRFISVDIVVADTATVFAFDQTSAFSILQSQGHEVWARFFGSSFKDDLRYIPDDCFETFPFPPNWQTDPRLPLCQRGVRQRSPRYLCSEGGDWTRNRAQAFPSPIRKILTRLCPCGVGPFRHPERRGAGGRSVPHRSEGHLLVGGAGRFLSPEEHLRRDQAEARQEALVHRGGEAAHPARSRGLHEARRHRSAAATRGHLQLPPGGVAQAARAPRQRRPRRAQARPQAEARCQGPAHRRAGEARGATRSEALARREAHRPPKKSVSHPGHQSGDRRRELMDAVEDLSDPQVPISQACSALGLSRATLYRQTQPAKPSAGFPRAPSPRRLSDAERQAVLDVLHTEEFVDQPPGEVHARLLSRGVYLASVRTMYRLLALFGETGERRAQRGPMKHANSSSSPPARPTTTSAPPSWSAQQRGPPHEDLQPLPRPQRARPRYPPPPRAPRRHGPRRPRRLRLDRHPHRLRLLPRLRDRRRDLGRQEEALPLPLARRHPRRGPRPPARPEPETPRGRARRRPPRQAHPRSSPRRSEGQGAPQAKEARPEVDPSPLQRQPVPLRQG
jgi:hypothetical protein